MTDAKTFKVCLTKYPEEFIVLADNEDEAIRMAKSKVNYSVYESEVYEQ